MSKISVFLVLIFSLCVFIAITGCERDPLDPIQIGRFRPTPVVNIILDSLGVAEEEKPKFVDAEEPKPIDLIELEQDYILSPGDIIIVQIFELLEEATPYAAAFEISESGNISIPEVGTVQAAGLTEFQLEEEIKQILSPTILKSPSVTVRTEESPSRSFTILGEGLPRPGRYLLPGYTYRLADALAEAGSPRQFNVSYIYVTRYESPSQIAQHKNTKKLNMQEKKEVSEDIELKPIEPKKGRKKDELLEIIAPLTSKKTRKNIAKSDTVVITAAEASTLDELKELAIPEDFGFEKTAANQNKDQIYDDQQAQEFTEQKQKQTRTEWIFKDGRWVAVEIEKQQQTDDSQQYATEDKQQEIYTDPEVITDWPEMKDDYQTRVIRIPVKSLGVDPRYNVVIRPRDIITVPFNVVGEAVVMGNVNRQGYIDLTGRPMTLMQAIAAAGGLSQLAEPSRVEVRRRVGEDREQIVMVDLDKIAKGLQPDFFIKEDDTINVGTLPSSRFAAVLRNAFRATYGFGFIYDRNFADRDFLTRDPIPDIF